ncbi:glycoside hydrolase family 25 protein [Altererythrobacter sp. H2]|uniref:glycoside hydrolase family 25 protein n=1 Tax=Altererythrobacter sp. H2 TaxID=3108391 RepID=UPI000BDD5066|nr:glycoside hydrolase family 25 protein [Altererythrobacter sp. H2]OZA94381.1 MAG: lysozyme [Erythrobacter sp. 34-65-8]WRK96200.1 glycoside hydrolase family 25 protein [Altererythrobacter sp. H2]
MGRKRKGSGWGARALALLVLLALAGGAWLWWHVTHWTPAEAAFPDQGILVGEGEGAVSFRTAAALGAGFAYLEASDGAAGQDRRFARNLAAAREAGLQVGAVHRFDPCAMAGGQSANFVTLVPRGTGMLPPAIALERTVDACGGEVPDAAVASELMTLINQIEMHAGKPVILMLGKDFEQRHPIAARIERNLWVTGTRFEPTYSKRPWLLWTANEALESAAGEEPVRWVVARP